MCYGSSDLVIGNSKLQFMNVMKLNSEPLTCGDSPPGPPENGFVLFNNTGNIEVLSENIIIHRYTTRDNHIIISYNSYFRRGPWLPTRVTQGSGRVCNINQKETISLKINHLSCYVLLYWVCLQHFHFLFPFLVKMCVFFS